MTRHMRDSMAGDPHIAACFLSPSGRGIKPLVWTASEGPHMHRHAWATACKYLQDKYEVDPTSSKGQYDVARSCFLGWDAGLWIAPEVEPLAVNTSLIIDPPRDTRKPYEGGEIIRENRHQYLTSYTARLASMGLGESEIISAAQTLVNTRFDLSDGRMFEDKEILDSVQGAVKKFASYDDVKLGQYGESIARIFLGEKTTPIVGIVLRTHADRMRDTLIPPPSLIGGIMNVGGIGSMIAKPGHGKTLVSAELARCIASGEPFAGREVQQGGVIYVCTDSPDSTERRLLGIPEDVANNILTVADAPRFPTGFPELETAMDKMENLRLVILDTWDSNRDHIGGGYSEQDAQIEKTLAYLRKSAKARQINYLIVHHSTRENGEVARGSIVFDARCDWMGTVEKSDNIATLKTTKIRDGEQGEVGNWKINSKPHEKCPDGPAIPWLEYQEGLQAKAEAGKSKLTADEAFLKKIMMLLVEWDGPPPSIKTLHEATGAKWRGAVQEALATMRERGWCVPKVAVLTEEGKRAALELLTPLQ